MSHANPVYQALTGNHAPFALGAPPCLRYQAPVIPFAGLAEPTLPALDALHSLLAPSEHIWLVEPSLPAHPGLRATTPVPGLQMHLESGLPAPPAGLEILPLGAGEAPEMVALTTLAFPGYFRPQTYRLGEYFGIRHHGQLVAMAGERLAIGPSRELSAVCTHPAHTGKGYAASLIAHLTRRHAAAGLHSFLHVAAANHRAIALYQRLGFARTLPVHFIRLTRL